MFGDIKGHGFDLEALHLRGAGSLSRLTLVVCLLYVQLVATGDHITPTGQADKVDRTDHRDLSVFRLGWDFIARRLAANDPISDIFIPVF